MITIKKSPSADSRTAVGSPSKEILLKSSIQHIGDVQRALAYFAEKLIDAGAIHDHTKISGIDDFYSSYSKKLTGDDFKAEKWYKTHLTERHHLNDRCPDDVTLIDVLERIADIVVAGMARSGSIYNDSLSVEILARAYSNTIKLLLKEINVVDENID